MKVKQTQPTTTWQGMVRKFKSLQNDPLFYYCLTELTDMILYKKIKGWSATFHTLYVSLQMTRIQGQFFPQFS